MLRSLDSDLPRFKVARFEPGVNVVLAHRTQVARAQDTRNAVGKTSFVSTLDFLLGQSAPPSHILRQPELADATFRLVLDLTAGPTNVTRSGINPGYLQINGRLVRLQAWRQQLGAELFGLTGSPEEPTYRALVAFYLRSVSNGAFLNPTETHRKQSVFETQPPLAYLFGLDTGLVAKVREIADADKSLRELKKAAQDPILGMTLGRVQDLDAEIRTLRIQEERLSAQLSSFRVVDRYSEHRADADELSRKIRKINDRLVLLERRLGDLEAAIDREDEAQPDHDYLRDVYDQVGIVLPDMVVRRFEEVEAFHRSVVNNRRRYLESEHGRLVQLISDDRQALSELDAERSQLMRLLEAGGALETYNELQRQLGEVGGRLAELTERRLTVDRWENANRHLQLRSAELELLVSTDLQERRLQVDEIAEMYASFAYVLYGSRRPASLTIEASRTGYRFFPKIGGDASEGVRSMALFCFDLTMAVIAHRAGRGPNFLVHDSHLYDGVEARQVAGALNLASDVTEREGMQYIATMNSDDLEKAQREDPKLRFHQCAEMTDEYEEGGLFGIRFN
ncbi:ABC-three component system protein [Micromonospora sp. URMC 105]|uniref:ABC-three component system protein n=1 Tax=Micromonospora sp. URMC 105 TaxID=3423413 RepID=UPI003F1DB783